MRHAGHWKGSMVSKYVVEIETEDGRAAYVSAKIASTKCVGADLTVILDSGLFDVHRYRNAGRAELAYDVVHTAMKAVA